MNRRNFLTISMLGSLASAMGLSAAAITEEQFSRLKESSRLAEEWLRANGFTLSVEKHADFKGSYGVATVKIEAPGAPPNGFQMGWRITCAEEENPVIPWIGAVRSLANNGWAIYHRDIRPKGDQPSEAWVDVEVVNGPAWRTFEKPDWFDHYAT